MSEIIEKVNKVEATAFEKGINLEKEFCEFLKTDFGWDSARLRTQLLAANNMRGTQVDVLAERLTEQGIKLKAVGKFYLAVCCISVLIGLYYVFSDPDFGLVWIIIGVVIEVIAFILLKVAKNKEKEHAWVECKNRKTKTDIRQMQLTISQVNEYRLSRNNKYNFTEVYFVSSSGFIENALKLAEENNVMCYYKKDGKFLEAKFWEHY